MSSTTHRFSRATTRSPRQPSPPLDPFTPEPGPGPGERRAFKVMRLAWIVVGIVIVIVLYAALR